MAYFRVNTENLDDGCISLYYFSNFIKQNANQLSQYKYNCLSDSVREQVEKSMQILSGNLTECGQRLYKESLSLGYVINEYEKTEKDIMGGIADTPAGVVATISHSVSEAINTLKEMLKGNVKRREVTPYEVDNILFDDEGSYGGDQGSAMNMSWDRRKELWEIAKRNNPDISFWYFVPLIGDIAGPANYFSKMNNEGCGYVSMANVVFQEYLGREEDFERDFGYPMYYNGDLNYDALITDIYSRYDVDAKSGVTYDTHKEYLEDFMGQHGINVDLQYEEKLSSWEVINNLEKGDEVLVAFSHGNIYSSVEDGVLSQSHYINGGHSMMVTGVTKEGYLIVSSWGKKYYLNPNEIINDQTDIFYEVVKH